MKSSIYLMVVGLVVMPINAFAYEFEKDRKSNEGDKYIAIIGGYAKSYDAESYWTDFPNVDVELNLESNFSFGGAVGYYPSKNLRIEAEMVYRGVDIDTATVNGATVDFGEKLRLWNWMVNSYYTIPLNQHVSPYVGGGLGVAFESENDTGDGFAYQLMTGIDWNVDYSSSISGGYRYFKAGEFETTTTLGGTANYDVVQHIYEISYRLKF